MKRSFSDEHCGPYVFSLRRYEGTSLQKSVLVHDAYYSIGELQIVLYGFKCSSFLVSVREHKCGRTGDWTEFFTTTRPTRIDQRYGSDKIIKLHAHYYYYYQ
jgi:hypothetical protein